ARFCGPSAWSHRAQRREIGEIFPVENGMPSLTSTCVQCSEIFRVRRRGRPREYCSLRCRRVMELRRRVWDARFSELEDARLQSGPYGHYTMLTREQAEAAIARLLTKDPRP
ncbi:MAG: hypothetical protein ACP5P4_16970, partial [Steroidobacteraceae bacterium]